MIIMWKDIKGYEGLYAVNEKGEIKALERKVKKGDCWVTKKECLKSFNLHRGYLKVVLSKDGKAKTYRVHRIVAEAFIENPNNYTEVNHIDEDKTNNCVENLEWCNREHNIEHSIKSGKFIIKMVSQYDLEGNFIKTYKSVSEAERETGIPRTHICKCVLGRYGHKTAGGYVWKSDKDIV
jgi:hypothetical protein